ncbi:hypothetical protein EDD11_010126, partial [Mortierella claussenii]
DGKFISNTFSIKISTAATVDDFKNDIKRKKTSKFEDISSDELTLWHVAIPVVMAKEQNIALNSLEFKEELLPTSDLSEVFNEGVPVKTIHIMVPRPPSGKRACMNVASSASKSITDMMINSKVIQHHTRLSLDLGAIIGLYLRSHWSQSIDFKLFIRNVHYITYLALWPLPEAIIIYWTSFNEI